MPGADIPPFFVFVHPSDKTHTFPSENRHHLSITFFNTARQFFLPGERLLSHKKFIALHRIGSGRASAPRMKRESGANPGQSRCCEALLKS